MKSIHHSVNSKVFNNVFQQFWDRLHKIAIDDAWFIPDEFIWNQTMRSVIFSVRDNFDQL